MELLSTLFLVLIGSLAYGDGGCVRQTVENQLTFRNVQIVRQNESFGLHVEENVTLKSWIPISDDSYLGVDKKGRVLNVLKLSDRVIAKLLSGYHVMRQVYISENDALIAIDEAGMVFQYDPELRAKKFPVFRHWAKLTGISTCLVSGALLGLHWSPELSWQVLIPIAQSAFSAGMVSAFISLTKFEKFNDHPNGFISTGITVSKRNVEISDSGRFEYNFETDKGPMNLEELVKTIDAKMGNKFEVSCEDELIPRGIPESKYK